MLVKFNLCGVGCVVCFTQHPHNTYTFVNEHGPISKVPLIKAMLERKLLDIAFFTGHVLGLRVS